MRLGRQDKTVQENNMGLLTDLVKSTKETFPGSNTGRDLWREVFGSTDKEARLNNRGSDTERQQPVPGGTYGRSISNNFPSYKRLLQAMRSMAPGGWSDDRWQQTKTFTGITYVAVHRVASQLQQSEFQVYYKDHNHPDGKRPVMEGDPPQGNRLCSPYDLVKLLQKPNPQDYFGKIMYRWYQQKALTGTALTWMVPNALGTPHEIYSIPTAIAIPQPAINPDYPDGYYRIQPVYPYGPFSSYPTPTSAVGAAIPAQWMLSFKYPHPLLRYEGYSPQTGLNLHIDEVNSIDRSRFYKMKRSSNPDAVVQMDDMEGATMLPDDEIERIRAQYENDFQGPENHGRLMVASPGCRIEPWGSAPIDMEYQAGWEQLVSFIMGGFGITKPAAGMIEDASYATLFATLKQLYMITLEPECSDIASELTRHLAHFFGDNLIIEIRCKPINDHDVRMAEIGIAIQAGCITKNEVRRELKELGLPLTTEDWGGDMAMDPSPLAQEQMAEQQEQAMMGMQPGGMPPPTEEGQMQDEEGMDTYEQDEIAANQGAETPGNLSAGSLGPRKSIQRYYQKKSLYEMAQEVMRNGH